MAAKLYVVPGQEQVEDFLDGMNWFWLLFPLPENRPAGWASEDEDIEEPEEAEEPEGLVVFPELSCGNGNIRRP